jgi:carbon monoxide dehydrogenase subunit G
VEIEKTTTLTAPIERVWQLLLDPKVMGSCVPGVESIEVLNDTDYVVSIHVKMAFVSARFRIRGTIVEIRPPSYLRSVGVGEDSSFTSSLKQSSEVFLAEVGDGTMKLRTKVNVEVFGRLGSFGVNMVKTKADRMWEEFGRNFAAHLETETRRTAT